MPPKKRLFEPLSPIREEAEPCTPQRSSARIRDRVRKGAQALMEKVGVKGNRNSKNDYDEKSETSIQKSAPPAPETVKEPTACHEDVHDACNKTIAALEGKLKENILNRDTYHQALERNLKGEISEKERYKVHAEELARENEELKDLIEELEMTDGVVRVMNIGDLQEEQGGVRGQRLVAGIELLLLTATTLINVAVFGRRHSGLNEIDDITIALTSLFLSSNFEISGFIPKTCASRMKRHMKYKNGFLHITHLQQLFVVNVGKLFNFPCDCLPLGDDVPPVVRFLKTVIRTTCDRCSSDIGHLSDYFEALAFPCSNQISPLAPDTSLEAIFEGNQLVVTNKKPSNVTLEFPKKSALNFGRKKVDLRSGERVTIPAKVSKTAEHEMVEIPYNFKENRKNQRKKLFVLIM